MKEIIDVCCGSRMFWFDKHNLNVVFCDKRSESHTLCDGRIIEIKPDVVCDFQSIPFENELFSLAVFDPPHLLRVGDNAWMAKKYGKLPQEWRKEIRQGFLECFRVLKKGGILVFKWNETQIKTSEVLSLTDEKPLFGHKTGHKGFTHWYVFMK